MQFSVIPAASDMSKADSHGVVTLLPAPDGYLVDFDHPQRRDVVATCLVMGIGMLLAFLFVLQRFYVDICIRRRFGVDNSE